MDEAKIIIDKRSRDLGGGFTVGRLLPFGSRQRMVGPFIFFDHNGADHLPEWDEDGVKGRLIAGSIEGLTSKVKTYSPLFYLHWDMRPGSRRSINNTYSERAIYVASGSITVGGYQLNSGQMLVLNPGKAFDIVATEQSIVMLLGGEPIGDRHIFWNFVSSSKERIEQAKENWRAQRMKLPVGDEHTFIPLPE